MRILFVHQNFPAQFVHLAPALAARGHEVLGLTAASNKRKSPVPVTHYAFQDKEFAFAEYKLATHFAEQTYRGRIVALAAARMRAQGYVPDIIVGHVGWGEMLYLGEVWPAARRILYAEFFYRPHGQDTGFDPEFQSQGLDHSLWVRSRQASQLLTFADVREAVSPTLWQASTYPAGLRDRIRVIHDGIDTVRLQPDPGAWVSLSGMSEPLRSGDEVLTFVSRNLEPYRGFHIFMRSLPLILKERPRAQVVIVGGDAVSYGQKAPPGKTWRQIFFDEVADRIDRSRVHFVGIIPYTRFVQLMQVTRVHAYLTYPFVLSWSMIEALSLGALVVASRTPPVEEVIEDGVNGRLVDFFDVEGWARTLSDCLAASPDRDRAMRAAARQRVIEAYDLHTRSLPRWIALIENRSDV